MANMLLQKSFLGSTLKKPSLELKVRLRLLGIDQLYFVWVVPSRDMRQLLRVACSYGVADGASRLCRLAMVRAPS